MERTATTKRNGCEMASAPATASTWPSEPPPAVSERKEPAAQSAGRRADKAPRNGPGSTPRAATRRATASPAGPGGPGGPGDPGVPGGPGGPGGPSAPIVSSNSSDFAWLGGRVTTRRYDPGPIPAGRTASTCWGPALSTTNGAPARVTSGSLPKCWPTIVIRFAASSTTALRISGACPCPLRPSSPACATNPAAHNIPARPAAQNAKVLFIRASPSGKDAGTAARTCQFLWVWKVFATIFQPSGNL